MNETVYQLRVVRRLEKEFPDCVVIQNDPRYIQGLPDLLILFENMWFMLEVKRSKSAPIQPNQAYYVAAFNNMSYCSFIFPENEDAVFRELNEIFSTRISRA